MTTRITVKVIPRSSQNEVVGEMIDGTVKVKLMAPPVDGKANDALVEILAQYFGVLRRDVRIVRGKKNTRKEVEIGN